MCHNCDAPKPRHVCRVARLKVCHALEGAAVNGRLGAIVPRVEDSPRVSSRGMRLLSDLGGRRHRKFSHPPKTDPDPRRARPDDYERSR